MAGKDVPEAWVFRLLLWLLAGVLLGALVYWVAFASPASPPAGGAPHNPQAGLAQVTLYLIPKSGCAACNASARLAASIVGQAPSFGFNATEKALGEGSQEAQQLIAKYNITKLPALVVSSSASASADFGNAWLARLGTRESDGSYVYRNVYPPYYDTASARVVGCVDYYEIIPGNCSACENSSGVLRFLLGDDVMMCAANGSTLGEGDAGAQQLIAKYNITKLPALVLGPDASYYPIINYSWNASGSVEPDGWLVHRKPFPPYFDLAEGKVRGVVDAIDITDSSCTDCYNASRYRSGLQQAFHLAFGNVSAYGTASAEGRALIAKYNITAAPTFILSGEAALYPDFSTIWEKAGSTVEPDGWFVFRSLDGVGGKYRNLTAVGNATNATSS